MDSRARLHCELTGFLRQHCPARDHCHLVLLAWMVAGLLLSETVCLDQWKRSIPLNRCLPASWQRRCRRWLANSRIDAEALYGPLVLWAIQQWQKPGQALYLELDITVLWNRFCVVVLSVVCHGRAIPLLWQTLEHPSASVSAEVVITLLERAWIPIPLQALEPYIPSRGVRRRQKRPWFSRIELPPPTHSTASMAIA